MVVKSGAKIVFLFQEGVLVYQNIVSFCQNIGMSFYKFARSTSYDIGEVSPRCGT